MNEGEKILYKANYITFYKMKLVTESIFAWGWGDREKGLPRGMRKFGGMIDMFII